MLPEKKGLLTDEQLAIIRGEAPTKKNVLRKTSESSVSDADKV